MENRSISSPSFKDSLALMVVYAVWSTTFFAIHVGVETFPAQTFACARFLLTGILLLPWCFWGEGKRPNWATIKTHCLIGLLLWVMGNAVVCWAAKAIPTGLGAMLIAVTPFWMTWLSQFIPPKAKVRPLTWLGLFLGFAGLVILLSPKLGHPTDFSHVFWLSVASLIVMSFFWALGSLLARQVNTGESSILMGVGLQNLFAGLCLLPLCFILPGSFNFHPSGASILSLLYLSVVSSILTNYCYMLVLQRFPVSVAGTFAYVTPPISVMIGALFLHETITSSFMSGSLFILLGVMVIQKADVIQEVVTRWRRNWSETIPTYTMEPGGCMNDYPIKTHCPTR